MKTIVLFSDLESDDLVPPGYDEIKDNQWLGVTVRSQGVGGKVMVSKKKIVDDHKINNTGRITRITNWFRLLSGMRASPYCQNSRFAMGPRAMLHIISRFEVRRFEKAMLWKAYQQVI